MPGWFAKTEEMVQSDLYFSLLPQSNGGAGSTGELENRYVLALDRLWRPSTSPGTPAPPDDYQRDSRALTSGWSSGKVRSSLDGHFRGHWIHDQYPNEPLDANGMRVGGDYWTSIPSSRVLEVIRTGTEKAIHKALGRMFCEQTLGLQKPYLDTLFHEESKNKVEVNGVVPLATTWNCVAETGSGFFEADALRAPTVVELAIGTPKPEGFPTIRRVLQRVAAGVEGYEIPTVVIDKSDAPSAS